MLKLKNSAMLVVAVLCGYLAVMTPDWKSDLVASSGQAYLGFNSNFDSVAGGTDDIVLSGDNLFVWNTGGNVVTQQNWLGGTPEGGVAVLKAMPDSNGDGTNDLIFQAASGNIYSWTVVNNVVTNQYWLGTIAAVVVGTGDFDGDHDGDLVLQDGDNISIMLLQNGQISGFNWLGAFPYTVKAVGDVNGDTVDDVIVQDATYSIATLTITTSGTLMAATWQEKWPNRVVVGVGDGNGDGHQDVYTAANIAGLGLAIVPMFAGQYTGGYWVGNFDAYTVKGLGDFDGDGLTDYLLQDGPGNVASVTITSSYGVKAAVWLAQFPYDVKGAMDTDGDNDSDVVMQDGSGNVAIMEMQNGVNGITSWIAQSAWAVTILK